MQRRKTAPLPQIRLLNIDNKYPHLGEKVCILLLEVIILPMSIAGSAHRLVEPNYRNGVYLAQPGSATPYNNYLPALWTIVLNGIRFTSGIKEWLRLNQTGTILMMIMIIPMITETKGLRLFRE